MTNPQLTLNSTGKKVSLKIGNKMGCLLSPRLFKTVLEILASAIREEEEIKVSKLEKKT